MRSLALHVGGRLILLAAVLFLILREPSQSEITTPRQPKPFIESTLSIDLQLAQLYLRTNGTWTEADRVTLLELFKTRGELDKLAYLAPDTNDPTTIESLLFAAESEIQTQNWSALENTLTAILNVDPENPQANAWMAYYKIPSDAALVYLQKAAAIPNGEQALAASLLGIISVEGYTPRDAALRFLEREEWAFAERLFSLQLEADNLDGLSYAYRGLARDQLGRDGYHDIQAALALEPALPIAYYALGMHYRLTEQFDKSLQAFEDAYLLDQQNPALAVEVAIAYQLNDEYTFAEDWFGVAASLAPDDERFASLQAAFYADTAYEGEEDRETIVRKAAQNFPDNATIQSSWARLLYRSGDYKSAEAVFAKAFELAPSDLRTHFFYGEFLEMQGDYAAALEHYSLVTQTDNSFSAQAQLAIRRLSL